MAPDEPQIDALVDAILEGTPLDWPTSESAVPPSLLSQLKVLAALTDFHRTLASGGDAEKGRSPCVPPDETRLPLFWGPLELRALLGRGSFGVVYRAWDTHLEREVALKLLPVSSAADGAGRSTLWGEGRLLARVRHRNVVTIYGAEERDGFIGLWMELVDGHTLEQILDERHTLSSTEVRRIASDLCEAVSAVHAAGLLHRDIKASNVMRATDGRTLLMDFGTGRELEDIRTSDLAGTPLYLAPEVLEGKPASVQSDVYSLGVVLYRLVSGSYPAHGRFVREIRDAHRDGQKRSVRTTAAHVPRRLTRLIDRATASRPEDRYRSAEEMHGALTADNRRRRLVFVAASVAALTLVAASGWEVVSRVLRSGRGAMVEERARPNTEAVTGELYLQARALLDRRGIPNALKARELFERVISQDPDFAPGYAGLANAHALMSFPYRGIAFQQAYPQMRPAALKAVALDPLLADAHVAMGWLHSFEHDWTSARKSFQRAIELNPTLTQAYTSYSVATLQPLGEFGEALRLLEAAVRHDPGSLDLQREIGEVQLFSGQYDAAVATFQRVSELQPDYPFVNTYLGRALTFAGRPLEALPLLEPGVPFLATAYVRLGRRAEAERLAVEWERYPYRLAIITAALGDVERCIAALEQAVVVEPHRAGRLLIEPELIPLKSDPRVNTLRKRLGLPALP